MTLETQPGATPGQTGSKAPAPMTPVVPPPTDADAVTSAVIDQAARLRPWATPWWVALLQGLIVAGLGVLYVLNPGEFRAALLQFLTLFLLIMGLLDTVVGLTRPRATRDASFAYYRGLVGFIGGLTLLSLLFLGFFNPRPNLGQTLFGVVAVAYGLLGLLVAFTRSGAQGRTSAIVGGVIFTLLGLTMLVPSVGGLVAAWVGPTLIVLGVGLVVFAFVRRSQTQEPAADAS